MKWFSKYLVVPFVSCVLLVACGKDPITGGDSNNTTDDTPADTEDIAIVNGKVRFFLSECTESARVISNLDKRNWATSKVVVNGKSYDVAFTEEQTPRPYIEVTASPTENYNATLVTASSKRWYNTSTYTGVMLPHSLFEDSICTDITSLPMYASYSPETGNKLIFNDGFSLLRFRLKGDAKISSVRVTSRCGKPLTGVADCIPSKGVFKIARGVDYVQLNTTNRGEFVELSETKHYDFYVAIAPGKYSDGLDVTICDTQHMAMFCQIPSIDLNAGKLYSFEWEYAPDNDLVFYEGFDNCVWGGDVIKGVKGFGFSPSSEEVGINSGTELAGYEYALSEVAYNIPGTGFVQSNTWSDIDGKSVGTSHQLSASYVCSRNFGDTRYMFRVQEHPGYIAIGAGSPFRGVYCSPVTSEMRHIGKMKIKLRFSMQAAFNGVLHVEVVDGGIIENAILNGKEVELTTNNFKYQGSSAILTIKPEQLDIPQSDDANKGWSELELIVANAGETTRLYLNDENMESGHHGIYVDSIECRCIDSWERNANTLRVMVWNIQAGMWCDQHNNYDNFVAWIKRYDPDVCIWLESESSAPSNSASGTLPENEKFLPNGWSSLAARYGHSFVGRGGDRDNASQTITSRYPITTLQQLTNTSTEGKPLFHGSGHFTVEFKGLKINLVSLHLWYQDYEYGVSAPNQDESATQSGGDYYRLHETKYIINQTINNPNYATEKLWLLCGDMNSRSRRDNWLYKYPEQSTHFLSHDFIASNTDLRDLMAEIYAGNCSMATTSGLARLDFMYLSPQMLEYAERAAVIIDSWCQPIKNGNARDWLSPSDHRPLLVDFRF
ncbi:MAG: metal-dependent hydrolase [Alistipes sp.]|nr:metal-dependent hydrolase [Alistipes sp.]